MAEPAQKMLVSRFLDWDRVRARLSMYKHIGAHYSIRDLRACSDKGPYYCHYLAWRLGTYHGEQPFNLLDQLLARGGSLPGWHSRSRLLAACSFDDFWGLMWELQMAAFLLVPPDVEVEWLPQGPDLRVATARGEFFVECYTYRKSFAIEQFVGELLSHVHPNIRVRHRPFLRFSLPKDRDLEDFLDALFTPLLDEEYVRTKVLASAEAYPVLLPVPEGVANFHVYIETDADSKYDPSRLPDGTGEPVDYIDVAVKEIIHNKGQANSLKAYHPNLLAANVLLSADYQMAGWLRPASSSAALRRHLCPPIDAILLTVSGIDRIPAKSDFTCAVIQPHPFPSAYGLE